MKQLSHTLLITIAAAGLALAGCKKKDDGAAPASGSAPATGSAVATGSAPASGSAVATGSAPASGSDPASGSAAVDPVATADYLKVVADHEEEGKGKVELTFAKWTVVKAAFDPANLEGGTAELEIDPSSLSTGIAKRDGHLQSPDYLDVVKFPKATVKIANVKKTGDKTYSADATVNIHGIEKTWPLSFDVVSSTADAVQVKFVQAFSRLDFGIGKEAEDSAKPGVELQGQLTIKKS